MFFCLGIFISRSFNLSLTNNLLIMSQSAIISNRWRRCDVFSRLTNCPAEIWYTVHLHLLEFNLSFTNKYSYSCSQSVVNYSTGGEDATTSAVYQIVLQKSGIQCTFISGSSGNLESASVWTVSITDNVLSVIGPAVPCRYGYVSNIPEDVPKPQDR